MSAGGKKVPPDRDPAQTPGSPDAGVAPEWPHHTYADESSAVKDARVPQSSDDTNTGKKAPEPGDL